MYIYGTRYSKSKDTATPQFSMRGNSLYATSQNKDLQTKNRNAAMYKIVGRNVFQTNFHPDGRSLHPVYEIKRGGIYRTINHKEGHSNVPDFRIIDPTRRDYLKKIIEAKQKKIMKTSRIYF